MQETKINEKATVLKMVCFFEALDTAKTSAEQLLISHLYGWIKFETMMKVIVRIVSQNISSLTFFIVIFFSKVYAIETDHF